MADKVVKDMGEDFLVCSICMSQFKTPKMLPCIHSFCEGCLQKYSKKQEDKGKVPCPTCRKVCQLPETGVKGLQTNFHLINLAERVTLLEKLTSLKKKVSICESCQAPETVAFCADCNFTICSKCQAQHSLFPVLRGHELTPLDRISDPKFREEWKTSKSPYCEQHTSEKLRFFCKTCSKLVCRDCTIVVHSKHDCIEAMSQFESANESLSKLVEASDEYLAKGVAYADRGGMGLRDMEAARDKLEHQVNEHCQEMVANFEKDIQNRKQYILTGVTARLNFVEERNRVAKEWIGRMKNAQEMARKLMKENNPWEVIAMSNNITKALDELGQESKSLIWSNCDLKHEIEFKPSEKGPHVPEIGSYEYPFPDFVLVDNKGNFLLCQFDLLTDKIDICRKAYRNPEQVQKFTVEFSGIMGNDMEKVGQLFACYDGHSSLYFCWGSTVATVPWNGSPYGGVRLHNTVPPMKDESKIQHFSYNPNHGKTCIVDDSLNENMMEGSFTSSSPGQIHFQKYQTYTLKATSPLTFVLPAAYDCLYYTGADGLNTFDWGDHKYDRSFQIDPPADVLDISESKVIRAVCHPNTTSRNFPNYGNRNCNDFTAFILWKGNLKGDGKIAGGEGWVMKEYHTRAEKVVGMFESLGGEDVGVPLALYSVFSTGDYLGGTDLYLCDCTGTIVKFRREGCDGAEPSRYTKT